MSGLSVGRSHPRPFSGAKTLRRCQNSNMEADNVILIDIETESYDNVVIIDVPESLPKKTQRLSTHHMKDKMQSNKNVICIDDDDSHDISNSRGFSAGTSSKSFLDASTPVRLSKCKRTYSGNASRSNRFGLDVDSETESSDSDYSDCELVEDSSGEVQEQWEKAFSRKKRDFRNGHSDKRDDKNEKDDDSCFYFRTTGDIDFGWADETRNSTRHVKENCKRTEKFKSRVDEGSTSKDLSGTKTSPHKKTDHNSACPSNDEKGPVSENSSLRNSHDKEAKLQEESSTQHEEDKEGENSPPFEGMSIINEREKLKETDAYKRAMEEEWASRQQALQIQAEEAKNLRRLQKRRKAESLRLLDMERRQKERIEEVRSSQKKDEENMNLKEKVQAEVRNVLKKLEISCHSMGSLLHLLGISVGSWPNPSPQEVQTAYKRALFTFHPDRASQSDIRLQVESEEKFKLINRLKEKYKPF